MKNNLMALLEAAQNEDSTGTSDSIPATIEGEAPAALSEGEFVIPADIVSKLGNGATESGARILENFIKSLRQESSTPEGENPENIENILQNILGNTGDKPNKKDTSPQDLDKYIESLLNRDASPIEKVVLDDILKELSPQLEGQYQDILSEIFKDYRNEAGQ